jgi:hypothetical protein
VFAPDFAGGPNSIFHGHPQVHQYQVRIDLIEERHHLGAVGRFPHHFHVRLRVHQGDQSHAHDKMIVGHQDPDFAALLHDTPYPPSTGAELISWSIAT